MEEDGELPLCLHREKIVGGEDPLSEIVNISDLVESPRPVGRDDVVTWLYSSTVWFWTWLARLVRPEKVRWWSSTQPRLSSMRCLMSSPAWTECAAPAAPTLVSSLVINSLSCQLAGLEARAQASRERFCWKYFSSPLSSQAVQRR